MVLENNEIYFDGEVRNLSSFDPNYLLYVKKDKKYIPLRVGSIELYGREKSGIEAYSEDFVLKMRLEEEK